MVANPPFDSTIVPDDCAGTVTLTNSPTSDAAYTRAIVDLCYGAQAGPLQYVGYLSEGGKFSATPNDQSTVALKYTDPTISALDDPTASFIAIPGGGVIVGLASAESVDGPVTKDIIVTVRNDQVRPCTDRDSAL